MKTQTVAISERAMLRVWGAFALFALVLFVWALFSRDDSAEERLRREDLATALKQNPASWKLAREITARALDENVENRIALWRAAHRMLTAQNRFWPSSRIDFVKAGLFHWSELSPADRAAVKVAAGELLQQEDSFFQHYQPVWQVTRDMAFLRANRPRSARAVRALIEIATRNGKFDDYRALRDELTSEYRFELVRLVAARASSEQILSEAAMIDANKRNDGILALYLRRLGDFPPSRFSIAPDALARLVDYTIRRGLPSAAFLPFVDDETLPAPLRARIAFANGDRHRAMRIEDAASHSRTVEWTAYHLDRIHTDLREGRAADAAARLARIATPHQKHARVLAAREAHERRDRDPSGLAAVRSELSRLYAPTSLDATRWSRLCGAKLCTEASAFAWASQPAEAAIHFAGVASDGIPPYVEIYDNDALVFEGPLDGQQRIVVPFNDAGLHELRARVVNPRTRNLELRTVTILSPSA